MYKKILKKIASRFAATCFLIMFCTYLRAQDDPPTDPELIPLDPGSWVLVAAGVGYGVKKWKDSKKQTGKNQTTATFLKEEDETPIL